jgi:hypothetical protein
MKEVGLNIAGFCRPADLDKVKAAGLACFVQDEKINVNDVGLVPPAEQLKKNVAALTKQVINHPASVGFYVRDEPTASMFPGLGRIAEELAKAAPGKWTYVNLLPTYASEEQLGTATYAEYLDQYIAAVHPAFLSYDNYSVFGTEIADRFYTNLELVRRAAQKAEIPFWNCILTNAHFFFGDPTEATYGLQVWSTLAYGGRGIQYFTYFTLPYGNWRQGPIDGFGNRSPMWDVMRRTNLQLHVLAPWLLKLRSTGVFHSSPPPEGRPIAESPLVKSIAFSGADGRRGPFLVGELQDKDGGAYLVVVNKDLQLTYSVTVELRDAGKTLTRISSYSGQEFPFSGSDFLNPGQGALLRIHETPPTKAPPAP